MSINKYKPHLLVLPEDQANKDMANGFVIHPKLNARSIQILPCAGGWKAAVDKFKTVFIPAMRQYPKQWFVLLIDFDEDEDRLDAIKSEIPDDVKERVFVLGALSEPEDLKKNLGKKLEEIGESLADSCTNNTDGLWGHNLLKHNEIELERMIFSVKPFLFDQAS